MLTTAPHLYIRRPSPTTAEFTVTTCPPLTFPLRLLLLTIHLLRVVLVSASVLALYSRFLSTPTSTSTASPTTQHGRSSSSSSGYDDGGPLALLLAGDITAFATALLAAADLSRAGLLLSRAAAPVPDWALALACAAAAYGAVRFQPHTTESVLVLRGLGIQTCTSGAGVAAAGGARWWGWATQTRFIPTEKIRDVLINEAFRGFEVRYYLVVVVEGEEDVVVLFPGTLPRRKIVEAVWRGVRGCLVEGGTGPEAGAGPGVGEKG